MLSSLWGNSGYTSEKTHAANDFIKLFTGRNDVNIDNVLGNVNKSALKIFLDYSDDKGILQGKKFTDAVFADTQFRPKGQATINVLALKVLLCAGLENEVVSKFQEYNKNHSYKDAIAASKFIANHIDIICKNDKQKILNDLLSAFFSDTISKEIVIALMGFLNISFMDKKMLSYQQVKYFLDGNKISDNEKQIALTIILEKSDHLKAELENAFQMSQVSKKFANAILEAFEVEKIKSDLTINDVEQLIAGASLQEDYPDVTDFQTQKNNHEQSKCLLENYLEVIGTTVDFISPPPKSQKVVDDSKPLNSKVFSWAMTEGVYGDIINDGQKNDGIIRFYTGASQFNAGEAITPKPIPRGKACEEYKKDNTQGPQSQLAFPEVQVEIINCANEYNGLLPALSKETFRSVRHGYFTPKPFHVRKGIINQLDQNGHLVEYPLLGNKPKGGSETVYLMLVAAPAFGRYASKERDLQIDSEDRDKIEYFCALNNFRAQFHAACELAKKTGRPIELKTTAVGLGVFENHPKNIASAFKHAAIEFENNLLSSHVKVEMQVFRNPNPRVNEGPFEETPAFKFMESCLGKQQPEDSIPLDTATSLLVNEIRSVCQGTFKTELTQRDIKNFNDLDQELKLSAFREFLELSKFESRNPEGYSSLVNLYRAFLQKRIDFIQLSLNIDRLEILSKVQRNAKDFIFYTMEKTRTVDDMIKQLQYYYPVPPADTKYSDPAFLFWDFVNYMMPYIGIINSAQAANHPLAQLYGSFLRGELPKIELFKAINIDSSLSIEIKQRVKLFLEETGKGMKATKFNGFSQQHPPLFYQTIQPREAMCKVQVYNSPGGVANLATQLYQAASFDKKPNFAAVIAGNSGLPGGEIGHNPMKVEERLNDKTQEEAVWSNATMSTYPGNPQMWKAFYEDTIENQWGLLEKEGYSRDTIQGYDFVETTDKEAYNHVYVVDDCRISSVGALHDSGRKVLADERTGFAPSCPITYIFGNSVNAGAKASSKGTTARTLNVWAQQSYQNFVECIECTVRATLDAALFYGKRDVLMAGLSTGIYAGPHQQIVSEFPNIVEKVLNEEVVGTNKRGLYFDSVIIAGISNEPLPIVNPIFRGFSPAGMQPILGLPPVNR